MTGKMKYKGYTSVISFDEDDMLFYGDVVDLNDTIVFYGRSVDELQSSFHEVVDAYLESCAEEGIEPDRPYSGKVQLRMGPTLHRHLAREAAVNKVSLNEWILSRLQIGAEQPTSGASTSRRGAHLSTAAQGAYGSANRFTELAELVALVRGSTADDSPDRRKGSAFRMPVNQAEREQLYEYN